MQASLQPLLRQFVGVVSTSALLVVLVAFVSIPYSLNRHPGEQRALHAPAGLHMT